MQFPHMSKMPLKDELIGARIKALRESLGEGQAEFGERFDVQQGTVSRWEQGLIPKRTLWSRIAATAGVNPAEFFYAQQPLARTSVPIVGLAGAGPDGGIVFGDSAGHLGDAPMPPGGSEKTVAVEVRGASMRGIAEDGWFVYYDERRSPVTEDLIGELCVCWLSDGRVLIKTPYQGRGENQFDLESTNAATMRDISLEGAAMVTAIIPRGAARKLRRNSA